MSLKTKNINKIKLKRGWNSKYEFSWQCKKTKFTTGQIVSLKIKKKQVKSIKVVNCNINAAIKLQCTYNDAIRTLFAQRAQPKYRDLSTNNNICVDIEVEYFCDITRVFQNGWPHSKYPYLGNYLMDHNET